MATQQEDDEKPGIEERYTRATTSSNLRVETREDAAPGAAGILIAAGWNQTRIGGALLRLHTEYDGSEKPRPATMESFLSTTMKPDRETRKNARRRAHEFNLHELGLLLQKLKSLPAVREQLTIQLLKWGVQDAETKAVEVLRWWLAQACPECGGTKFRVAEGTGRHTAKACDVCLGTGRRDYPGHDQGWEQQARRLANFMDQCVERARAGMQRHMGPSDGRSADLIKERCRAILAANPHDTAAQKALDGLPLDTDEPAKS